MPYRIFPKTIVLAASLLLISSGNSPAADSKKEEKTPKGTVLCTMKFSLKSWSAFYKSGKGYGTITCNNKQTADVKLRSHGGGITFGKYNIPDGEGEFSAVKDIKDLYGKYGAVGGEAGAVKSTMGQSLSKDDINLDIKGTGTGGGFGFDFSGFRISPMTDKDRKEMEKEKREEAEKAAKEKAEEEKKKD
jgi:hypothetical protein